MKEIINNSEPNANNTEQNSVIYLVKVGSGCYEDYVEHEIFATIDKDVAEKWRDRYNLIISNNTDRINSYYDDDVYYDKPEPFWFNLISYDRPIAMAVEVELR